MNRNKRLLIALLVLAMTLVLLTSCFVKKSNDPTLSINGEENIELPLGGSITFTSEATPSDAEITWSVDETNLGDEYVLEGSTFTAKQTAGYAVIKASGSNGVSDYVTIVINRDFAGNADTKIKVAFYAADGETVIDVRYADAEGRVSFPDYAVANHTISWLDADGIEVDTSTVTVTEDSGFTAKATALTVYYTVRFWYYDNSGAAVQVGETFSLDFNHGESVSPEQRAEIEAAAETATGKDIVNWKCVISADGTTVDWYAEFAQ